MFRSGAESLTGGRVCAMVQIVARRSGKFARVCQSICQSVVSSYVVSQLSVSVVCQ